MPAGATTPPQAGQGQVSAAEVLALLYPGASSTSCGWVLGSEVSLGVQGADAAGVPWYGTADEVARIPHWAHLDCYYCTSTLRPAADGSVRRTLAHWDQLRALVLDDAQPQAIDGLGVPTYVVQTSPGCYQIGVVLDPDDPDTRDLGLCRAVVGQISRRPGNDVAGNNPVRYVRLPWGSNTKPRGSGPWQVRLTHWRAQQVLTLADACGVLGLDYDAAVAEARQWRQALEGLPQVPRLGDPVAASAAPGTEAPAPVVGAAPVLTGNRTQADLIQTCVERLNAGVGRHDAIRDAAASLIASGVPGGAVTSILRGLCAGQAWASTSEGQARIADIPRAVRTAELRFGRSTQGATAPGIPPAQGAQRRALLRSPLEQLGTVPRIEWLVRDYFEARALSLVFGPPGSAKSFLALDVACCVATGTPWHGKPVTRGPVVIVAGEGHGGISRRLAAWDIAHKGALRQSGVWLRVTTAAVPVLDTEAIAGLRDEVLQALPRTDDGEIVPPALVIVDTVARNYGPGDENSTKDMSQFVANIDSHILHGLNTTVMLVHHTGHDQTRERGSSALRAALDQSFSMVKVAGDEYRLKCHKMKDAEEPPEMQFKLNQINIIDNPEELEFVTSAALEAVTDGLSDVLLPAHGPRAQITVADALALAEVDGTLPTLDGIAHRLRLSKTTATRVRAELVSRGYVQEQSGWRYVVTEAALVAMGRGMRLLRDDEGG